MSSASRQIRRIAILNFLTDLRFYAPVAVLFYASATGSYAAGMAYFSIAALTSLAVELPAGVFSDRFGRAATLRLGAASHAVSSISLAAAAAMSDASAGAVAFLYAAAFFEGAGRAFYSGNNDALLHDLLDEEGRRNLFADILGRLTGMFQAALAVSALIGGFLASRGWLWAILPSAAAQAGAFFVALSIREAAGRVRPERGEGGSSGAAESLRHLRDSVRTFFTRPGILGNGIAEVTGHTVGESTYQFRAAFVAMLWPAAWLGAARMLDNVAAMLSFLFAGRLIKRFGEYPLLIAGKVYGRLANVAGLLFPGLHSPALMSSAGLFFGVTNVARQSLLHAEYDDGNRATLASVNSLLGALALAVFAPVLGWVADRLGVVTALLAAQGLMLLPLGLDIALHRKTRREHTAVA